MQKLEEEEYGGKSYIEKKNISRPFSAKKRPIKLLMRSEEESNDHL